MRFIAYTVLVVALAAITYMAINMRAGEMDTLQPAAGNEAETTTYTGALTYRDRMALSPSAILQIDIREYGTENVLAASERALNGAQVPVPFTLSVNTADVRPGVEYYLRGTLLEEGRPSRITRAIDVAPINGGNHDLGELVTERAAIQPIPDMAPDMDPDLGEELSLEAPEQDTEIVAQNAPEGVIGVTWTLTDLNGEAPVDGSRAAITFGTDGRVSGNGGCNNIGSGYTIEETALEISPAMISTMMACVADGLPEQERAFTAQLVESRQIDFDGDTLVLITPDGRTLTFTRTE